MKVAEQLPQAVVLRECGCPDNCFEVGDKLFQWLPAAVTGERLRFLQPELGCGHMPSSFSR